LEENMFKAVVVVAAALVVGGTSIVHAQQHSGGPGCYGDSARFERRDRLSAEDMAAFADARIAALKAGLVLTSDQAKNWSAFEQALRDMAQLRIQRRLAREAADQRSQAPTTPFERLARRADNMSKTSAALKRVADTGAPLYQSLDETQKNRFTKLARFLRPHHGMHAYNEGDSGGWREEGGAPRDSD
jgi:zinc resistance-associated protein